MRRVKPVGEMAEEVHEAERIAAQPDRHARGGEGRAAGRFEMHLEAAEEVGRMKVRDRPAGKGQAVQGGGERVHARAQPLALVHHHRLEAAPLGGGHLGVASEGLGRGAQVGERPAQARGGALRQLVEPLALGQLVAHVLEGERVAGHAAIGLQHRAEAALEKALRIDRRAHDRDDGRRRVPAIKAQGEPVEGVQDRLARDQGEEVAAQAQRLVPAERANGGLVVEQHPVVGGGDDHGLAQLAQDGFEPGFLLRDAPRGAGHRLDDAGARPDERLAECRDGRAVLGEESGCRRLDPLDRARAGESPAVPGQARERSDERREEIGPDQGGREAHREDNGPAEEQRFASRGRQPQGAGQQHGAHERREGDQQGNLSCERHGRYWAARVRPVSRARPRGGAAPALPPRGSRRAW